MKRLSVIGHFAFGKLLLNGQTIKTKVVAEALEQQYHGYDVRRVDTHGGALFLLKMPFVLWDVVRTSENVVVMPAHNGVRTMLPMLCLYNMLWRRNILYVVIGGWLPAMLQANGWLRKVIRRINGVFVETVSMKRRLESIGIGNVYVMPNCKKLDILKETPRWNQADRLPLCTFSRVMEEKGIAEAVDAVKKANDAIGEDVYSLDIYGQVEKGQEEWFSGLMNGQPEYIRYRGCVAFDKSVEVLAGYYALLFPTHYQGEGFAGTVIDAFAAGLPVIATDWHDNADIIRHGQTGYVYPVNDTEALARILLDIHNGRDDVERMRRACTEEARRYQPHEVIMTLVNHLKK